MSQVPTDAFGRPKYLASGKKNPNFGKDNPGEGSDYRAELGGALLDSRPKESHPTKRVQQTAPRVFLGGDAMGTIDDTKKWLDRNVAGKEPPRGMRGFGRYAGDAQVPTWSKEKQARPPSGQIFFYPDNWQEVGVFIRYDPSDFGVKNKKPYWVHLETPEGAGFGNMPAEWAQWTTHWAGAGESFRTAERKDLAGRAVTDPRYGSDPTGNFRGHGASGSW